MSTQELSAMDLEGSVTIIGRSEELGPVQIRVEVKVTHELLDPEDPRQPDDVVIVYDRKGGGELEYLAVTLDTTAETLRSADRGEQA
jgi:hypothetical protein